MFGRIKSAPVILKVLLVETNQSRMSPKKKQILCMLFGLFFPIKFVLMRVTTMICLFQTDFDDGSTSW